MFRDYFYQTPAYNPLKLFLHNGPALTVRNIGVLLINTVFYRGDLVRACLRRHVNMIYLLLGNILTLAIFKLDITIIFAAISADKFFRKFYCYQDITKPQNLLQANSAALLILLNKPGVTASCP